jgi:signal transduction histidine kinase
VIGALAIPAEHKLARLKPWFLAGAALAIALGALGFMAPVGIALTIYNVTILVAIGLQFVPLWSLKRIAGERRVPVFVVAAAVSLLLTGLYIFVFRSNAPSAGTAIILNRAALAWLVVFGSFMSMRRIIALRDDRARVLTEALAAAEKESELNKALLDAERNYASARDVAARQRERFAEASHDIKQPIASLRASVDSLAGEQSPQMRAQLQRAFDYLESLANTYGAEAAAKNERTDRSTESVPVALLLQTLEHMFRAEAKAKGLTFEVQSNDGHIGGDPLGIMRILSNLVSNAIHHTRSGTVRLSAAAKGDRTVFEVFSTGEAISLEDIDRIFEANQKGEHSEGQGLGLAIVKRIAQSARLPLELRSLPGQGNSFSLSVPSEPG